MVRYVYRASTKHFFRFCLQVYRQAELPRRVNHLALMENKLEVSFPTTQRIAGLGIERAASNLLTTNQSSA